MGKGNQAQTETQFTAGTSVTGTPPSRSFHTSATTRLLAGNLRLKNIVAHHAATGAVSVLHNGMGSVRNWSSTTDSVTSTSKSDSSDASKQAKKGHKAEVSMIYSIGKELFKTLYKSDCYWLQRCD